MKFLDTLINLNDDSEGKRKIFDIFKGVWFIWLMQI
jgi:hypothetical protein